MQTLRVPAAQDVVRFLRPTVEEIVFALKEYYERQPGWNYGPARAMARPVYSGDISLQAAVAHCRDKGNPFGRKSNAEVAECIWRAGQGRSFQCYDLSPRLFGLRKDLAIRVDPLFYFVEKSRVKLFWLQPRRGYAPSTEGLAALAVMIRMTFADEFDDPELELLDLSVPPGERERLERIYRFDDLPTGSDEVVSAALQRFAEAYDIVCKAGVPRPSRRPRPDDREGPTLFD